MNLNDMIIETNINKIKDIILKQQKEHKSIGFVPTMGYLHEGHLNLIKESKQNNDFTVVSIFVNPTQFGENEDLLKYPRDLENDIKKCNEIGVDLLFLPDNNQIYDNNKSFVIVEDFSNYLEGKYRPNHFKGVTTIVMKLFCIIKPNNAYFGEKDWQQLNIIKKMTKDLFLDVNIVNVPTKRENNGLAMSSRNSYLTKEQQEISREIYLKLKEIQDLFNKNSLLSLDNIKQNLINIGGDIDYLEIINEDLQPVTELVLDSTHKLIDQEISLEEHFNNIKNIKANRIVIAIKMFGVRLIDNIALI